MSDQRDQLPNDGSESVDEDMLFVVEDVDESSTRPTRAASAARPPSKGKRPDASASTRLPTGESRVIVGSRKPRNPLYDKLAKHAPWAVGVIILCLLAPRAVIWIENMHWRSLAQKIETVTHRPQPAPEPDEGADASTAPGSDGSDTALAAETPAATLMEQAAASPGTETSAASPSLDEYLSKLDDKERADLHAVASEPTEEEPTEQAKDEDRHPEREETIIELKNGHQFRGMVKKMTDDQITLSYAKGQYTFARADVNQIIPPGSREYQPIESFPEAFVRLKRGSACFRAHVLKDSSDRVVLGYAAGKLTFARAEIADIKYVVPDEAPFTATLPHFELPAPPPEEDKASDDDSSSSDGASASVPETDGSGSGENHENGR
jgi:hypothetical protein